MIRFYAPGDPYGAFSNFSRHEVRIYDKVWQTSEHAFQAMKFHPHRPDLVDVVHAQDSPGKAARVGRDRSNPLRGDWNVHPPVEMIVPLYGIQQPNDGFDRAGAQPEKVFARVKDVIMYQVVLAKFQQHQELAELLLSTGDQPIIEDAEHDPYWGWGASRVGENKLGRILMIVRDKVAS